MGFRKRLGFATFRNLCLLLSCFVAAVGLCGTVLVTVGKQEQQERVLENALPKHLPIKVKIKKEKEAAFKNLKNERWARDFYIEVENTGNRPIYFLDFLVAMPEILGPGGFSLAFPFSYGRHELGIPNTKADSSDVPIMPGESVILSPKESTVEGWERGKRIHNRADPKKLILELKYLSFGDGTGFGGTDGTPYPQPKNESSSHAHSDRHESTSSLRDVDRVSRSPGIPTEQSLMTFLPARFWPAVFLSSVFSDASTGLV